MNKFTVLMNAVDRQRKMPVLSGGTSPNATYNCDWNPAITEDTVKIGDKAQQKARSCLGEDAHEDV